MNSASRSRDCFASTRWSLALFSGSTLSLNANAALAELAQRYWYPSYAYIRRCGHAPAIAQDITHAFVNHLIRQFHQENCRPPHGHFRRFLLEQLNAFLGRDWREMVENETPSAPVAPADLEVRNQRDNAGAATPEQAYHHSFALEVIARALQRLLSEARQTGHLAMFEALQSYLALDPVPGELQAISVRLRCQPLTLAVALKRLRQRFRELALQELADTVTSADDLASEQVALHAALKSRQAP